MAHACSPPSGENEIEGSFDPRNPRPLWVTDVQALSFLTSPGNVVRLLFLKAKEGNSARMNH